MTASKLVRRTALAALAATALVPAAALASPGGYYRADLAAPAPKAKTPLKGVVVRCTDSRCAAPRASTAPTSMCAAIARKIAPVAAFSANGEPFDAAAIARCNGGN